MTKDQNRRILEAIADCDKFIAKESSRNPSLRPADIQKTLDFYIQHRSHLIEMLQA
jgi:hypothetical protein